MTHNANSPKAFLFLQGPVGGFFRRLGAALQAEGHKVSRINLNLGDQISWSGANVVNFRGTFNHWPDFLREYLLNNAITDIVLLGECRPYHRIAIKLAKELGINVSVTDFGYLRPDWIALEPYAMNAGSMMTRDPDQLAKLVQLIGDEPIPEKGRFRSGFLSMAIPDLIYNIASQLCWFLYPHYRSHQKYNAAATYIGLGLRLLFFKKRHEKANRHIEKISQNTDQKHFLLPLQMETDYQLRAYSPYSNMDEVMDLVLESFSKSPNKSSKLIIKLHPYDPAVKNFRKIAQKIAGKYGVNDRVDFIDGGDGEKLLSICAGVVTLNSTMGLQALIADTPVFTLSDCNYRVEGLVKQDNLDEFWQAPGIVDTELRDIFIKALIANCMIRGVFYEEPGLTHAISEAKRRLASGTVGKAVSRQELDPRSVPDL